MVFTENGVAGRNEKFIDSPTEFKPERWLRDGGKASINPFLLMPFGHGSRLCLGKRFAEQELYLGISAVCIQLYFAF